MATLASAFLFAAWMAPSHALVDVWPWAFVVALAPAVLELATRPLRSWVALPLLLPAALVLIVILSWIALA